MGLVDCAIERLLAVGIYSPITYQTVFIYVPISREEPGLDVQSPIITADVEVRAHNGAPPRPFQNWSVRLGLGLSAGDVVTPAREESVHL
jgi:hypothetical protein